MFFYFHLVSGPVLQASENLRAVYRPSGKKVDTWARVYTTGRRGEICERGRESVG